MEPSWLAIPVRPQALPDHPPEAAAFWASELFPLPAHLFCEAASTQALTQKHVQLGNLLANGVAVVVYKPACAIHPSKVPGMKMATLADTAMRVLRGAMELAFVLNNSSSSNAKSCMCH